jgi:hypothetical protein
LHYDEDYVYADIDYCFKEVDLTSQVKLTEYDQRNNCDDYIPDEDNSLQRGLSGLLYPADIPTDEIDEYLIDIAVGFKPD